MKISKAQRRKKVSAYYKARRAEGGECHEEYKEYMRLYMRAYRASKPEYREHERLYNQFYARRRKTES